jgi:hypothetical protein
LTNACAYPQVAHVSRQMVFVEPIAYRNLVDFSPQVSRPITQYPNLVWAPHIYTHAFTLDQFMGYPISDAPFPTSYTFGYQTGEAEAQAMHAALFTTEFGDSSSTDGTVLAGETAAQESTLTGGTVWAWKGLSQTMGTCWCVRWQHSTYQTTANGQPGKGNPNIPPSSKDELIPSREQYLARVWPRATAGKLLAYQYDPTARTFTMVALGEGKVSRGDRSAETLLYIPTTVHGSVSVSGGATLDTVTTNPDGSRYIYVAPTGSTQYEISVGTPSSSMVASVGAAAKNPPQPITEPEARQAVEQFITQAEQSPSNSIAGNAHLAGTLATLLLGNSDPAGTG